MVVTGNNGDGHVYNKYLTSGTTYEMGLGDDTVYGGKGDDTYLYNLGDGDDHISDSSGADSLRFGAGISADDIGVSANDSDMLITLSDGQVITITNWYSAGSSRIEQFEFADGTVWEASDILNNVANQAALAQKSFNQLIQAYSSFDDGTDDIELSQIRRDNLVITPFTEHQY